jgi:predicted MPP superfamily phosphohydrolase
MEKNKVIVHLSDLHFPKGGARPPWVEPFHEAIEQIASNPDSEIYALAITGDLVDSPDEEAFQTVKEFLSLSLTKAGILADGLPNMARVWVVGGNHDYKTYGIFRRTFGGKRDYPTSSGVNLLTDPFEDQSRQFQVFGLHSGEDGLLARGKVPLKQLKNIAKRCRECDRNGVSFAYRLALIHHHLIPLPSPPEEWDTSTMDSLKRRIDDEAFMLLGNAGLTTAYLLDNGFHLVLHGHKHKEFLAQVRHSSSGSEWRYPLIVIGSPEIKKGFHVLHFTTDCDVKLEQWFLGYKEYERQSRMTLLEYEDYQQLRWKRLKRTIGYYEETVTYFNLSSIGDATQVTSVKNIFGGLQSSISELTFRMRSVPSNRGAVTFDSVVDLNTGRKVLREGETTPGPNASYVFKLVPAASCDKPHKGFKMTRSSRNTYSITTDDGMLRSRQSDVNVDATHEKYTVKFLHPIEDFKMWFSFPNGYAPTSIDIKALIKDTHKLDVAETKRCQSTVHFNNYLGVMFMHLKWITPDYEYDVGWDLPDLKLPVEWNRHEDLAQSYLDFFLEIDPRDRSTWINIALVELQKDLISDRFGDIKGQEKEALEVGLFAFSSRQQDDRLHVVPVAGTYDYNSSYWNFQIPWGDGVRGLALRRGRPEFYSAKRSANNQIYVAPPDCSKDKFLLAVPVVLPPNLIFPLDSVPPGFFKMVLCVHSPSESSGLMCVTENADFKYVCDKVREFWGRTWPRSPLFNPRHGECF